MLEYNISQFDSEAQRANTQLDIIAKTLEQTEADLKSVTFQRDQALNEIEELKTTITTKDTKIETLSKSIYKTERELSESKAVYSDLQSAFTKQNQSLTDVKVQTKAKTEQYGLLQHQKDDMKIKFDLQTQELERVREQSVRRNEAYEALETELNQLKMKMLEKEKESAEQMAKIEQQRVAFEKLNATRSQLRQAFDKQS